MSTVEGQGTSKFRPGDLVLLFVILFISACLVFPFVFRVSELSGQTQCLNQLRQLGLACHSHQDSHGTMPPGYGPTGMWPVNGSAYGTAFYHLLPFLDQKELFQSTHVLNSVANEDYYWWASGPVREKPLRILQCPADPSMPPSGVVQGWGATSYAFNAQVFCQMGENGALLSGPDWQAGTMDKGADSAAYPKLPDCFSDGGAQTIIFAERYAQCGGSPIQEGFYANLWAYPYTGHDYFPVFAARVGYVRDPTTGVIPPQVMFQVQPTPWGTTACNPHRASTGHRNGINIGLADASVRTLSPNVQLGAWWKACGNEGISTMSGDW